MAAVEPPTPSGTTTTPPPPSGQPPALTRHISTGHPSSSPSTFDIVTTYQTLLHTDPDLTMPVAAIESLVQLLRSTPTLSTISETLDLLNSHISQLKRAVPNAISLSAGTDLFMRYLITALRPGSSTNIEAGGDFAAIRAHLLSNAQVFVARAKEARLAIAGTAKRFVRAGSTILTTGGSRAVLGVLQTAATEQAYASGAPRFKVIYVTPSPSNTDLEPESAAAVASLRNLAVPVAVIPESAVAYCMQKVSMAIVGAEGVVENGGIISRLGTYQMAVLAKAAGKPVYVVAESHKFVRMFPLGQFDLGVEQHVLEFSVEGEGKEGKTEGEKEGGKGAVTAQEDAVDYTPPGYITALVTEAGVLTPSAVSEELIKIWD